MKKRKTTGRKIDTSVNGDAEMTQPVMREEVLLKVDRTTWILVSKARVEKHGEQKCIEEFSEKLNRARRASLV